MFHPHFKQRYSLLESQVTLWTILAVTVSTCSAAQVISLRGKSISFGEWSAPSDICIDAWGQCRTVLLRSCEAKVGPPTEADSAELVNFIADPKAGHYWIGKRFLKYFFFKDRIVGIETSGAFIHLREGFASAEAFPDETSELTHRLANFTESPFTAHVEKVIDLTRIFGSDIILSNETALIQSISITSIQVGEHSLEVRLKSITGTDLLVVLDSNLTPSSAKLSGEPILLLDDGATRHPYLVSSPKQIVLPSTDGNLPALQRAIDFPYAEAGGGENRYMAKCVVVEKSGLIWFGPERSHIFAFTRKLVGIEEMGTKINIYPSVEEISTASEAKFDFRAALNKFGKLVSSGVAIGAVQIDLRNLFPGEIQIETEIVVLELRSVLNDLGITFRKTDASRDRFRILINDQLEVSAKEKSVELNNLLLSRP